MSKYSDYFYKQLVGILLRHGVFLRLSSLLPVLNPPYSFSLVGQASILERLSVFFLRAVCVSILTGFLKTMPDRDF